MKSSRFVMAVLLCGLFSSGSEVLGAEQMARKPIAIWEPMGALSVGMGFRENVLRSGISSENSPFYQVSGDASVMRYSETGAYLLLYFLGEDIRYSDAPSVNYEQFLSVAAKLSAPFSENDEAGVKLDYFYQHQVIDASETEVDQQRVLVLGHGATFRPYWEHAFQNGWAAKLEGTVMRQVYEHTLDDYWESERLLHLMYGYGHRSEVLVGCETTLRFYETREQYDAAGQPVAGTDLVYSQHEAVTKWKHYWDAGRQWRTVTRLSFMLSSDNGSGYFDYERALFREQVRWDNGKWRISAGGRLGWYHYVMQKIGDENRTRSYAVLDLRIERMLGEYLVLYASGEHEWSESNDPLDDYRSWQVSSGIGLEY